MTDKIATMALALASALAEENKARNNRYRTCSGCTLCCTLIPVDEVSKVANQRCRYQSHKGCKVYGTSAQPYSCMAWQCQWLAGEDVGQRPDRSHVVVDIMMDGVRITPNEDPSSHQVMKAVQVWCDPHHRDAHRDPRLRAWLATFCEKQRACVIVRYSSDEGVVLMPPWVTGRDFVEMQSNVRKQDDPRTIEDRAKLGVPHAPEAAVKALVDDYNKRNTNHYRE